MRYLPFDVLRVCPSILERFMLALACAFPLPFFSTLPHNFSQSQL